MTNEYLEFPKKEETREIKIIDPMVLVGFGKHDLIDLMDLIGSPEEYKLIPQITHWPPRWRRGSICTDEEISLFGEYTRWLQGLLDART